MGLRVQIILLITGLNPLVCQGLGVFNGFIDTLAVVQPPTNTGAFGTHGPVTALVSAPFASIRTVNSYEGSH